MKLAIIGYGKLGRAVGEAWVESGGDLSSKITSKDAWSAEGLDSDVVLESSTPETAAQNILDCLDAGLTVVVGSTGWHSRFDEIEAKVKETNGLLFHATNFSIGVHLMNVFATEMARTMKSFEDYTPSITEAHHIYKLDIPSGTANTLKSKVENSGDYSSLKVESIREGEIVGMHELVWDSEIDSISIKHDAKSRKGFALGAVKASNWILELKSKGLSGVFTMDDMIKEIT